MFNIKYLVKHKVQMHAGANKQEYGFAYVHVRPIIHSLKRMGYLTVQTHKLALSSGLSLKRVDYLTVKTHKLASASGLSPKP